MTDEERAITWMKEHCAAADGPRYPAAGEGDEPGEPHCSCLESLTRLLATIRASARAEALREAAEVCRQFDAEQFGDRTELDAYGDRLKEGRVDAARKLGFRILALDGGAEEGK